MCSINWTKSRGHILFCKILSKRSPWALKDEEPCLFYCKDTPNSSGGMRLLSEHSLINFNININIAIFTYQYFLINALSSSATEQFGVGDSFLEGKQIKSWLFGKLSEHVIIPTPFTHQVYFFKRSFTNKLKASRQAPFMCAGKDSLVILDQYL